MTITMLIWKRRTETRRMPNADEVTSKMNMRGMKKA
jgi:hypothetical protein